MPDVTLVTPTRDRPEAFKLCVRWMSRQTYVGAVQWLIIDDGDVAVDRSLFEAGLPAGWTVDYVRRPPTASHCTLQDNMLAAMEKVSAPKLLIIEDDDYYSPIYVEEMVWRLDKARLVGESNARYYNVRERRWSIMSNSKHASFCRTGLTRDAYDALLKATNSAKAENDPFIDLRLWGAPKADALPPTPSSVHRPMWGKIASHKAKKQEEPTFDAVTPVGLVRTLFTGRGISIGIKGLPGRGGLGRAHALRAFPNVDANWQKFIEWLGPDARPYIELAEVAGWKAM